MSGATTIVYNNQGTVSFVSEDEYLLYTVNDKGNTPVEGQSWHIEYYGKDNEWINENSDEWPMLLNYMPVLNSENRLTPAPLYVEGLDYIPVVICTVGGNIAWVQPIIIAQNRYASSTLNDWNGSLTIDEKNGTILATAIGAGKKEADNSFSGVLMGDIGRGFNFDPDNMSGLGVYGFNEGAQSFCLNVDGKAFFGKAGRGRIYIDGDSGTISSASFQQNRNYDEDGNFMGDAAAGMLIDLDDGFIHMRGTKFDEASGKYQPDQSIKDDDITSYAQAEILLTVGEGDDYQITNEDGTVTDVDNTAYLKIRSAKQYVNDHYLIYVGSEKYYLQTDDYNSVFYSFEEGAEVDDSAAGAHLNLANGHFDAYNFKLSSKNIFINSANETGEYSLDPYFVIRDVQMSEDGTKQIGVNLLYAGANEYYLKSNDFTSQDSETGQGKGIKINLKDYGNAPTGIEAYNFDLKAGQVAEGKSDYAIILSDKGNPYLQINTAVTKDDVITVVPLVEITKTVQYFQSSNYSEADKTGIKLSLSDSNGQSYLKAYSGFTLQAYQVGTNGQVTDNYILIDSSATTYPFGVYGSENLTYKDDEGTEQTVRKSFKVGWNGEIEATGGVFRGTINATGGTFTGNIIANGTISGGTISGARIIGAYIANSNSDNPTFSVNSDGHLIAASANIGGWEVTSGSSGLSSGNTYVAPDGIGYNNQKFYVDKDGNLFATSATFDTSLVVKSSRNSSAVVFSVDSAGDTDIVGKLHASGAVGINTDPGSYQLEVNGNAYFNGPVGIGTTPESQGSKLVVVGGIALPSGQSNILSIPDADSFKLGTMFLPEYLETFLEDHELLVNDSGTVSSRARALMNSYGTTTLNAPDSGGAVDSVLVSTSTGGTTAWKKIGASLVNFPDGTTTGITKKTSGTATYYTITASESYTKATKSDQKTAEKYSTDVYLCWNDDDMPTSRGHVSTAEYTYFPSGYKYYTRVSSTNRKVTFNYYDVTETNETVSVSKDVQINVTLA